MDPIAFEAMFGMSMSTMLAIALLTTPIKAWAMWLAARRGDIWWFLAFAIVNLLAIPELIYIFFIAKQSDKKETPAETRDTSE